MNPADEQREREIELARLAMLSATERQAELTQLAAAEWRSAEVARLHRRLDGLQSHSEPPEPRRDPWDFDYEAWLGLTDETAPRRSVAAWEQWHAGDGGEGPREAQPVALVSRDHYLTHPKERNRQAGTPGGFVRAVRRLLDLAPLLP